MDAGVIAVAVISALTAIQLALANSTRKLAKEVKEQTVNDHQRDPKKISNLRDNIDSNQFDLVNRLELISRSQTGIIETQTGIIDTQRRQGNKIDRLFDITHKHNDVISEMTQDTIHTHRS
jgi:hypothetical protein